jgi:transglutaminase-like putative cysteine protease
MKPPYFVVALLFFSFSTLAQKKPLLSREPAWVTVNQFDYANTKFDHEAEDGYIDIAYDEQLSVEHQSLYCKRAIKILTEAGIQNNSEVSVDFDPTYQQLFFHSIKIIRGNTTLNQLNLAKIKTIQREKDLDKYLYDGSLSSVLFLEDIRKGDIIEYSYTIKGFNPIFKGKFACVIKTNYSVPVYNMYYKIIIPRDRIISIKNNRTDIKPDIKTNALETSYEWKLNNVSALHAEDRLPEWFDPYSSIMISEYKSWKEVNDWAMELFVVPSNISPALQKQINLIRSKYTSPEEQALQALRFVQDDIHYMGIEIGPNSHKPNPPDKVFSQRFGDCKDKSYLLCTMLQKLGIECSPVLINSGSKKALLDWLPSPKAFDHVTVRVKLTDGYHWFDPTISYQRGGINDISYPDYQCGLVVAPGTESLTRINTKEPGMVNVKEVFDIAKVPGDVRFIVTTNYSGSFADNTRDDFNTTSRYELLKDYRNYYLDYYEDIVGDSLAYEDNEKTGVFTTVEYYTIHNLWELKNGERAASFSSYVIDGVIKKPKETQRKMPYALQYPAHYKEEVEVDLPEDWNVEESSGDLKNEGFEMKANFSYHNRKLLLQYEYESLKDNISPDETEKFLKDLNKRDRQFSYQLTKEDGPVVNVSGKSNSNGDSSPGNKGYIVAEVLALLFIIGVIWQRQRR